MKSVLLCLGLLSFLLVRVPHARAQADSKGGGNGQLVVVPSTGTSPVPYEVAKSWDSGVYRNFYKLPQVGDNLETRARFNKAYGVHALAWLEVIKEYSGKLHADLVKAGKRTSFRFLDNLILWDHEPYPNGEVDYKKYEKAAFFNGEIIFSIPVMDKMEPLEGVLSKEENQGFVVIHELINAAYPNLTVKQKLVLGELVANIKILKWSKKEFIAELFHNQLHFLVKGEKFESIMEGLKELGEEQKPKLSLNFSVDEIERKWLMVKSESSVLDGIVGLLPYMSGNSVQRINKILRLLQDVQTLNAFEGQDMDDILTVDLFKKIDGRIDVDWGDLCIGCFPSNVRQIEVYNDFMKQMRRNVILRMASYWRSTFGSNFYAQFTEDRIYELFLIKANSFYRLQDWVFAQNYKRYIVGKRSNDLTEIFEADLHELSPKLNGLDDEIKKEYAEAKAILRIREIRESSYIPHLQVRKNMKVRFIKNKKHCPIEIMNLRFDEIYKVNSVGEDNLKLQIVSSPESARIGRKVKYNSQVNYDISVGEFSCKLTVAEML